MKSGIPYASKPNQNSIHFLSGMMVVYDSLLQKSKATIYTYIGIKFSSAIPFFPHHHHHSSLSLSLSSMPFSQYCAIMRTNELVRYPLCVIRLSLLLPSLLPPSSSPSPPPPSLLSSLLLLSLSLTVCAVHVHH